MKELHRLPSEVERDNPDLTMADIYQCFALRTIESKAFEELKSDS